MKKMGSRRNAKKFSMKKKSFGYKKFSNAIASIIYISP